MTPLLFVGSRQCIEMCKEQIRGIIHQYAPQAPIGGIPGQDNLEMLQNMAVETVDMLIPQNKVGLVIGMWRKSRLIRS